MAVTMGMFLFEVVVQSVKSLVESRNLIIRSDFADIFSLELKDPKQMHIVMPEPPPLPPEPPGKKGKKKPPKPKKGKGKKGKEVPPPPEPVIQSGQSVLFTSSAEILLQNMKKFPLEVSLWSKEDNLALIGATVIPWDNVFLEYLEKICDCQGPLPVALNEEYNIFEEGTAKLMAKLGIQVKLTYLTDKVTTAFRTLSEDSNIRKCLYTGINSKTTSYMCTMKTTDEDFKENCNKIENKFIKDKPKPNKVVFADYKNAPGANLTFFNESDYCCMGNADKPPESIYKAPETCPDIDFIVDYVRKIIVSCNDNLRMLTPQPTIRPRVKATDVDRLCYCKETSWPEGKFAERFKKEVQNSPCPTCINAGKRTEDTRGATFHVANIRGPCGKYDCRIARDMRAYIENLVEEDNKEIDINAVIGPCGSKSCDIAEKIKEFLRHEGIFGAGPSNVDGLSTQCACIEEMQKVLTKQTSCDKNCSKECLDSETDSYCEGRRCPFGNQPKVYNVYYFTVEHDFDQNSKETSSPESSQFNYCSTTCPSMKASEKLSCSKSACSTSTDIKKDNKLSDHSKCTDTPCSGRKIYSSSPADSDVVINLDDIHNPCCVKSCDVADTVKDFIADAVTNEKRTKNEYSCYCDCTCTFKFSKNTTYCPVCGGYECLGDDMRDQPEYVKPHPCPVYHKSYDKTYIKVESPFPKEEKKPDDITSMKSSKPAISRTGQSITGKMASSRSMKSFNEKKEKQEKSVKAKTEKKKVGKFTANVEEKSPAMVEVKLQTRYPYPAVPKHMGWNWTAEDIPGMKPRPKWKPGAANKILVRRYRAMREGLDILAKKKRALMQRKKKVEYKPMLVVKKRDGEYTVQMEVFKKYSNERLIFQSPYDEKPPLIYKIGKTEAEKAKIQKQRERRERRETRRKSRLLQSSFRDRCQEICLKAYNQAIGILPLPNPNDPNCPCYTSPVEDYNPPIDSCSCSDEGTVSSSDTDGDEWTIEFSPPAARHDAKAKHPSVLTDNESQYTYLDYKVKLLDKYGNPVPRFFKGPDGKQECSDLGGFWGPGHVWLEINKDGYLGPDDRWVPMNFIGPDGMFYSAEEGSFTDNTGRFIKIGVDGYIDKDGKWAWYGSVKKKTSVGKAKSTLSGSTNSPNLSKIIKQEQTTSNIKTKAGVKSPAKSKTPPTPNIKEIRKEKKKAVSYVGGGKAKVVMNLGVDYDRGGPTGFLERSRKKHGNTREYFIDAKKLTKYREIMQSLQSYDDLPELRYPSQMNRACNTPRSPLSPYSSND